jgi:hypothetical protein
MGSVITFPEQPLVAIQGADAGKWHVVVLKPGAVHPEIQVTFASRIEALINAREGAGWMRWRFIGCYTGEHRHVHA